MRNLPAPIATFSLLTAILILAVTACKKDTKSATVNITGKWSQAQFQGILQYEFKSDQTVEYNVIATDSVTKQIIGYRYKDAGRYTIKNDSLIIYYTTSYANSKGTYGPVTELVPTNTPQSVIRYSVALNSQKNKLSLYFSCPPNADCVPSPIVFSKQE